MSKIDVFKNLGLKQNLTFNVIDLASGKVVSSHKGHNTATNSLLTGIGHYLKGDGVLNQGSSMLSAYIPRYISLGTMGLETQAELDNGLPKMVNFSSREEQIDKLHQYLSECPGFGADGYDLNANNNRRDSSGKLVAGLGKPIESPNAQGELISLTCPRVEISFRDLVPEYESELAGTVDVVYSAMISTNVLSQFRDPDKDYIFISEAGLWSTNEYTDSSIGENGLLAGYRIVPPDDSKWDMTIADNRTELRKQILRVGVNQVVQVIWKIQLGALHQFLPDNIKQS